MLQLYDDESVTVTKQPLAIQAGGKFITVRLGSFSLHPLILVILRRRANMR